MYNTHNTRQCTTIMRYVMKHHIRIFNAAPQHPFYTQDTLACYNIHFNHSKMNTQLF